MVYRKVSAHPLIIEAQMGDVKIVLSFRIGIFWPPHQPLNTMNPMTPRTAVISAVQALSDESIDELAKFIDYLHYKTASQPAVSETATILDPKQIYEVWSPINAPSAAQTLMSLLDAEKTSNNV
jgi:hypothetical protein